MTKKVKLAYLVSHPIQYQAPLLRRIAQEPDIELTVFFGSDFSVRSYKDEGFGGVGVKWDVPLLDGYCHEFLPALRDKATVSVVDPLNHGILKKLRRGNEAAFDVLWVHGYSTINALHGILAAKSLGIPVLLRAESWLKDRERSGLKLAVKHMFFKLLKQTVDGVLPIGT
ncbi:MAG: glycosyltransferase family 1 protein, partial [Edaphobacter sp.]